MPPKLLRRTWRKTPYLRSPVSALRRLGLRQELMHFLCLTTFVCWGNDTQRMLANEPGPRAPTKPRHETFPVDGGIFRG
jgi:hypothetical protein